MWALKSDKVEVAEALLEYECDTNVKNHVSCSNHLKCLFVTHTDCFLIGQEVRRRLYSKPRDDSTLDRVSCEYNSVVPIALASY
jgi:hypothetical protein